MIQVTPVRHDISGGTIHARTHVLTPRLGVTLTVTLEGKKENILSILEDHLLETISGVEWNNEDSDKDFTFLTENYNRFIRNLEPTDLANISIVVSLLQNNALTISAIGSATAYLVEADEISAITVPERGRFDFHTLTTGEVSRNATIFISNRNSEDILGDDLLVELSEIPAQEFTSTTSEMLAREINFPLHIIRIAHSFKNTQKDVARRGRGQLDLLKNKSTDAAKYIKNHPVWKNTKEKIAKKINEVDFNENKSQKYAFIGIGVVVLFFLFYTLLSAIGGTIGGGTDAAKAKILEAQTLIEDSAKLTSDQAAFEANIAKAEELLTALRNEQKYLTDVETLQNKIDVTKKEVYGIEIISLDQKESIAPIKEAKFEPVATYEINNKLLLIGKTGLMSDYVRGTELPKILTYPSNTNAISATINDTGTPFIISEAGNIMTRRQDNIVNATIADQTENEFGKTIREYYGNLYTLNPENTQIYKYKPSPNGYSAKANVLNEPTSTKILDFAVDGGFYILQADGKIGRFISTKSDEGIKGLVLNKLPGSWTINANDPTELIASGKLSYIYIRNGKKIWVFQPNSRNFQDVNALTYIAQLEIQTDDAILDISVPRDGIIYTSTVSGIFETQFEIKDSKLYIK